MNTTIFLWANRIRQTGITLLAVVGLTVLFAECPWQSIPITAVIVWAITLLIRFTIRVADRPVVKYYFRVLPQIVVHTCVAFVLGVLLALTLCGRYQIISVTTDRVGYVIRLDKLTGEITHWPIQY
jgi:hypothetical protein